MATTTPGSEPRTDLSRAERVGLVVHRVTDKWFSPVGVWVMRRSKGGVGARFKVDALVLTTTGRRSGRSRSVVLQYFPDGDAWIVAAANDGGAAQPAWYLNLSATHEAQIEVNGTRSNVRAEELGGDEAIDWWARIVRRAPDYERYARATSRTIPIIRLVPRSDA
jgi:F420H(2)-dependent quinone reductase